MNSLFFSFIKRAIIVPLIVAVIAAGAILFIGPRAVAKSNTADNNSVVTEKLDLTGYSLKNYDSFKKLSSGDFVGTVKCDNISLGEKAILFDSSEKSGIVMSKASVEPWNGGGVLLLGANTSEQFELLHDAKIGEKFEVNFYNNDAYTYKLKKIVPTATEKELTSYIKDNRLVLCLQYNDFKDLGNSYYYQVFIAERV